MPIDITIMLIESLINSGTFSTEMCEELHAFQNRLIQEKDNEDTSGINSTSVIH